MRRRLPSIIAFVSLAYAISWLIWSPLWLPTLGIKGLPVLPFHHALGALGPCLAAFVVIAVFEGRERVTDLARRIVWPGPNLWIASIAGLGPLGLLMLSLLISWALGERADISELGTSSEFPQFSALAFFVYNFVSFGIGEEVGWRGFLLPRLQSRWNALAATAIVTLIWAGWHAPLFLYRPGYLDMGWGGALGWLVSLATGAVLTTSLFNSSRGSVLVVALFHAAIDVVFTGGASSPIATNVAGALITVAGLVTVFGLGARDLSRSGRVNL